MTTALTRLEPKIAGVIARFANLPDKIGEQLGNLLIQDMVEHPPTVDELRAAAAACTDYSSFQQELSKRYEGIETVIEKYKGQIDG